MELAPAPKRRKATCFASMSKEDRHDFIKSAATVAIHDGLDYLAAAQKVANQQEHGILGYGVGLNVRYPENVPDF